MTVLLALVFVLIVVPILWKLALTDMSPKGPSPHPLDEVGNGGMFNGAATLRAEQDAMNRAAGWVYVSCKLDPVVTHEPPQSRPVGIRKCSDCAFSYGSGIVMQCRCTQLEGYADCFGADSFPFASSVRKYQCHGNWWSAA